MAFFTQNNVDELRAERLRRAAERLRSPVVFNKEAAVRKTQLKSFSQYVETRPGEPPSSCFSAGATPLLSCSSS
ncbi:hypothetical protein Z043_113951 [Scleropages formosus]|uniref:Uncharacterized protein n=1 Tax=Scleropages formosus TaxID=113540 RepID=A0A0P7YJ67_SCLFO|nr:hypothetical protein Z043_113951 [Scleropages formosus]